MKSWPAAIVTALAGLQNLVGLRCARAWCARPTVLALVRAPTARARDGLWDAQVPAHPAELEDFTAYDARMNEISLDDEDFESELHKLLDGGSEEK